MEIFEILCEYSCLAPRSERRGLYSQAVFRVEDRFRSFLNLWINPVVLEKENLNVPLVAPSVEGTRKRRGESWGGEKHCSMSL